MDIKQKTGAVYLDYNSTTPLAPEVVATITQSLQEDWANPSSDTVLGRKAHDSIELARTRVAQMVQAECPEDIIFNSGGTESNNTAIWSAVEWGRQYSPLSHVVISNVEHVATSSFVQHLVAKCLIELTEVCVDEDGCLQAEDVIANIRPETVLVSIMMANNETGVLFPCQQIGRELRQLNINRKHRVWFHVDAAQAVGKVQVNVQNMNVDYLTIVGHKFYGPRIGALYARKVAGTRVLSPLVKGGGQEQGLRPGTENTPMIAGLGRAALLVTEGLDLYTAHMQDIREYLLQQLNKHWSCIVVNCENAKRLPNTLSVSWRECGLTGVEILAKCPRLMASTTAACHDQSLLSDVLLKSGVPINLAKSTIRLSVGRDTMKEDINMIVKELVQALSNQCNS